MPSSDREDSRDRELVKHQLSFDSARSHIPMYVLIYPLTVSAPIQEDAADAENLVSQVGQL